MLRTATITRMVRTRIDDRTTISRAKRREAEQLFHGHLKRVGLKRTAQRDTVFRIFLASHEHLSTDQLYRRARRKDPKIGFTTVYRTLKLLTECGLAGEVAFADGVSRYEHRYQRRNHDHMVCTRCGSSVEFFSPEIERVQAAMGRKYRYQPARHTFQIYGVCQHCRDS